MTVSVWLARISDSISLTVSNGTALFSSVRIDLESLSVASRNVFLLSIDTMAGKNKNEGIACLNETG